MNNIVQILESIFGECLVSKKGDEVSVNCPYCDKHRDKHNLSVNLVKGVFHCWSCGYRGSLYSMIKKHSKDSNINLKDILNVKIVKKEKKTNVKLYGFRKLTKSWDSIHYFAALDYLKSRNIGKDIIEKFGIGYCEVGYYKNRIVIPNINVDGKLDFFVTRSFYDCVIPKYLNPAIDRTNVIFGEKFLDWNLPIVLVEGPFDCIVTPNSVSLLGSALCSTDRLSRQIFHYKQDVIVCLDNDSVGRKSSIKIAKMLFNMGIPVSVVKYPYSVKDMGDVYSIHGKFGIHNTIQSYVKISSEIDLLKLEV